jgi:hypothetical protein
MSVREIEVAITKLPAKQVGRLTAWLVEYHHKLWDKQIEEDLESGRLDALLEAADKDHAAGMATPLMPRRG